MRFTIIHNPVSGGSNGTTTAERARRCLERGDHRVEMRPTVEGRPVADIARRAAEEGADRVIAIGGDGTATGVAAGLLASGAGVPLAIVPGGTANVLSLNLGIPGDVEAAVEVAIGGKVVPIDVGRVDGQLFLLTVSTGLHAEMVALADQESKRRWGVAAYGLAGWKASRYIETARHVITCDGEPEEFDATMVQVMNCGAIFRRSWELAPGVSPVDGMLDVLVYRAESIPEYLVAALHVVSGKPTGTELVAHRRATRVSLDANPPVRLQRDGEPAGWTPVEITFHPRVLPVVMPKDGPWAR